ncbi:MAG: type I 3-dehydroquinate dehydratase [Spirochaetes bacterium]|jgi:3-dehydroquinate dehydratase/shikimate dehydrogenase|nr:type I 3-dehydroquinate dehydratase [Spirochaetota bacterium]
MSGICLSLTETTIAKCLESAAANAPWIDMCELRGDFLTEAEQERLSEFPAEPRRALGDVETILTLRRGADGGQFHGSQEARLRLLEKALAGGFTYIDLEDELFPESGPASASVTAVLATAQKVGTRLIRSRHDFSGTPEGIVPTMLRMAGDEAIPKLAVTPNDSTDLLSLFHACDALAGSPFVLLGMGQIGVPSRILCLAYGAAWTYASDPAGTSAAPGHLTPQELRELYRVTELDRETAVFGVVGNPVGHSRSPQFHNERFIAERRNAVYVPFQAHDFFRFMHLVDYLGVQGLSVTLPHKASAAELAQANEHTPDAADAVTATGACNTLIRRSEGWSGVNTDIAGFLAPLDRRFDRREQDRPPWPRRATVIGAGGVARAVVYALLRAGVEVLIVNRTEARAKALAAALREHFGGSRRAAVTVTACPLTEASTERIRSHSELLVQTTNQGMTPNEDRDPIVFYEFTGQETVYDLVYTPEWTRLLTRAESAGCSVISGKEMFIAQAHAQANVFTTLLIEAAQAVRA